MELILFLLACVGLTLIINTSYLFKPVREYIKSKNKFWGKLVVCSQCTGFWSGLLVRGLQMWCKGEMNTLQWSDLYNIAYGFAASFVCYAVYLLLKYFMEKYD